MLCLFFVVGAQRLYSAPMAPLSSQASTYRQIVPLGSDPAGVTFVAPLPAPVPQSASMSGVEMFAAAFLVGVAVKTASLAVNGRVSRSREPTMVASEPGFWAGFKMAMPKQTPIGAKEKKARDKSLQFNLFSRTWEEDQLMTRFSNGPPGGDGRILTFDRASEIVGDNRSLEARFAEVRQAQEAGKVGSKWNESMNESMKEHQRSQAAVAKASEEAKASTGFADPPRVKWNYDASGVLGGMQSALATKMLKKMNPGAVVQNAQEGLFDINRALSDRGSAVGPIYPWKKMKAGADELEEYVNPPKTSEPTWRPGTGRKGLLPTESSGPLPWEA